MNEDVFFNCQSLHNQHSHWASSFTSTGTLKMKGKKTNLEVLEQILEIEKLIVYSKRGNGESLSSGFLLNRDYS